MLLKPYSSLYNLKTPYAAKPNKNNGQAIIVATKTKSLSFFGGLTSKTIKHVTDAIPARKYDIITIA